MKKSIAFLIIFATGIIIYSNSFGGDFVWDDWGFVLRNDFIKDLRLIPQYFSSKEALASGGLALQNYRPILVLSYAIDHFFWGLNPLGYHLTNTLFHIGCALLFFNLVLLLTKNSFTGILASLIFLTHPIQTEAVTWISGRADVLFLFFYLAAFLLYVKYGELRRLTFYLASLIFFIFSLLSKEMAASLPFVIILYDIFYSRKEKIAKRAFKYFGFFLVLEIYLLQRFNILGKFAQCGYWTGDAYTTFLSMARGLVHYVKILLVPINLCVDHLVFPLAQSIKEPATFLSILAIFALLAVAFKLTKKEKLISFSIFFFFITLAPAANIIPIQILIAERFLYLPSIGYSLILATVIVLFSEKLKKKSFKDAFIVFVPLFLICFYSHLTIERNKDWADDFAFNRSIIKVYPMHHRAHYNLAVTYSNEGFYEKSFEETKKAIASSPTGDYPSAKMLQASYYQHKKKYDKAVEIYRNLIKKEPLEVDRYLALAQAYSLQKKYDLAQEECVKALAIDPDFFDAKIMLAALYKEKEGVDSAIKQYEAIFKEPPPDHYRSGYAIGYLRLGELYFIKGDKESAIQAWVKVYKNFQDQWWISDIAEMLIGKTSTEDMIKSTSLWQPELKAISYYFAGTKKEMDGFKEIAKNYYRKAASIPAHRWEYINELANKRLDELEENPSKEKEKKR